MSGQEAQTIRLFGLVADSIVDGIGYRTAIFTQGCHHGCEGCHNPDSHDPAGGALWTLDKVESIFSSNPLLDGITLSGGEPFEQAGACGELARRAHRRGLSVWIYSGYTYEELLRLARESPDAKALLDEGDVLVDGKFTLAKRTLDLPFCGSRNQRVIDLVKTRNQGSLELFARPQWEPGD